MRMFWRRMQYREGRIYWTLDLRILGRCTCEAFGWKDTNRRLFGLKKGVLILAALWFLDEELLSI